MIFLNCSREVFYVNERGDILADMPDKDGVAVFNEASAVKGSADSASSFRYCSRQDRLYYCEKTITFEKCKSLLHALNLREGYLVGARFSNGTMLLLGYVNGLVKKILTAENVNSEQEISLTIKEWWGDKPVPYEVYGFNLPFESLVSLIKRSPLLIDNVQQAKQKLFFQKFASGAMVAAGLLIYCVIVVTEGHVTTKISTVKKEQASIQSDIKKETLKRLPLYIQYINIPLDGILRQLSFLEGRKYSTISVTAQNGELRGDVTVEDAGSAYVIKEAAGNGRMNLKGGVFDIGFDKKIDTEVAATVSHGVNLRDFSDIK